MSVLQTKLSPHSHLIHCRSPHNDNPDDLTPPATPLFIRSVPATLASHIPASSLCMCCSFYQELFPITDVPVAHSLTFQINSNVTFFLYETFENCKNPSTRFPSFIFLCHI